MNHFLKQLSVFSCIGVFALGLSGCASAPPADKAAPLVPIAPKTKDEKLSIYNYLLNDRGVSILEVGETRTIVMSSDVLFTPHSANISDQYLVTLKLIARLINLYDTTSVSVNAYTNVPGDTARALTEKQAQEVVYYLTQQGVDTRLLYAKGYGNAYPVNLKKEAAHFNKRIEIKFQFHPEKKVY